MAWIIESPAIITALLDAGADPKARDTTGSTPLHFAAFQENPALITVLLDAGADPKARDIAGLTPLHAAAMFTYNPAVITVLLDAGADPKARDIAGKTPWDYAKDKEPLKTFRGLLAAARGPVLIRWIPGPTKLFIRL